MKHYDITSTKDGEAWCLRMTGVSEWSLKQLRRILAEHGVELHATFTHAISDKPVFRHPTEEELDNGQRGMIRQ